MNSSLYSKKAQLTIFIIVAVVLVAAVAGYFILRERLTVNNIPTQFQPIEDYYLNCIQDQVRSGISILEEQGGYIYTPEFVPGNDYLPTSSQLSFMGTPIPYWYYLSGNNIIREQVPTKKSMQDQLNKYLEENLFCDFSEFSRKGFIVENTKPKAEVTISDTEVSVTIDSQLSAILDDQSAIVSQHKQSVSTKLGKFYNLALKIYNKEKTDRFLETYGLDTLYANAPVNGVELSCAPKVWKTDEVVTDVKNAIEENTLAMKLTGNYYTLKNPNEKYFVINMSTDESVQFMYSKDWPTKIEMNPNENGILIAEPVGNQQGLGILGFCYVPYHFIYDANYPTLIQIYDTNEIFQFPVDVIIQGNKPRDALPGIYNAQTEAGVCKYSNTEISVFTYDTSLNPIEADISFKCFDETCNIGKTRINNGDSVLTANFPQCVNGIVIAQNENYSIKKYTLSTNQPNTVNMILERLYNINVNFKIDNKETNDMAVISFVSDTSSNTIIWPDQKSVKLTDGNYNVSIYVYRNSTIKIPASTNQKCIQVTKPGILGLMGQTKEQCYDITIPAQDIGNGLSGGGKQEQYFTESELEKGNLEINSESLKIPSTLEELQNNFNLIESKNLDMEFK